MSIDTDVVIVGAGPVGLFQIFELGLLGIHAHVVESLPEIGGQCAMLYPEKPIYDIPALPVCDGRELVERLARQAAPFAADFHLGEEVTTLEAVDGGFRLLTSAGTAFRARAVVIAGGLGSFQARPLRLDGIERFEGQSLHYRITDRERFRARQVIVLGGGDSALDWALDLHAIAAAVTVVHRREAFRAAPASVARMQALAADARGRMRVVIGRVTGFVEAGGRIAGLDVAPLEGPGEAERVAGEELLVCYGLSPSLGPIARWELAHTRRQLEVSSETCQTSLPGVFAVGDINTYPGKKKLILSGFHEAVMAAYAVQRHLDPEARQHVQYTTTSTLLQTRLGVRDGQ